ncbi:phosphorylase family protein [Salinarimonas soli]|uniref:Nucleoside phosphorylase domain-containing protein n=1 Tax=Salinarimonas soli TaxID=1638099 RepID=A0A5B2VBE4_9HYPH|nr:hypothetical protein [Salinarimonas soli]KAA2235649.1 hypothetical protein F0L46_19350 [Salinarimonas soli]
MRIGVLTGLKAEARLLGPLRLRSRTRLVVVRTGADPDVARAEAERLAESGVSALLSFGLAGGLDPSLRAGEVVLADRVVLPDGRQVETHPAWLAWTRRRVALTGRPVHVGPVAGSDRLLASATEKQRLYREFGALAVDMESGAVAEAAEAFGLPFIVVRAVADGAGTVLPGVARVPLRGDGTVDLPRIARALLTKPGEWPAVARLALDTRAAFRSLRDAVLAGAGGGR